MSDSSLPANFREFYCSHCNGKIRIPKDLPSTTAPCPHCQEPITSPAPVQEMESPADFAAPAQAAAAEVPPVVSEPYHPYSQPSPPAPEPAGVPGSAGPAATEPVPVPITTDPFKTPDNTKTGSGIKRNPAPVFILAFLLLAIAGGAGYLVYKENIRPKTLSARPAIQDPAAEEKHFLRVGWQKEASQVLEKFLAAKTVAEKLPYILNPDQTKPLMESFYGGSVINDMDTPVDAFSVIQLLPSDHNRGIFMMVYDQPFQFDIKEFFRPLATLEVQSGIAEADMLLSAVARVGNFSSQPLRVNAFFKRTPQGLKLDWETFAQTKYHTFQTLTEFPEAGQGGIFRVLVSEDVPESGKTATSLTKTYRLSDPSSTENGVRVLVKVDSEVGRWLSDINWLRQDKRPLNRSATLELKWSNADQPELEISRFICWEFLNLGGEEALSVPPPPAPPEQ